MYVYQRDLLIFLAASVLAGIILSAMYDLLRVFRAARSAQSPGKSSCRREGFGLRFLCHYNDHLLHRKGRDESILYLVLYFIEDVIYCIFVAVMIVLLIYGFNWGKGRLFSFLAVAFGFLAWRATIGRIMLGLFDRALYILGAFLYYVFFPLNFLLLKIKKMIYKLLRLIYNRYRDYKSTRSKEKNKQQGTPTAQEFVPVRHRVVVMEKK